MDKVESVKAAVGLVATSPSSERSGKRKSSLSIRANQSSRLGTSPFTSLPSSQLPGKKLHDPQNAVLLISLIFFKYSIIHITVNKSFEC